jgi:hypothetical protein
VTGYVNLNLAIGAQISVPQHMKGRVDRAWQEFDLASTLLPNAPDPHLGQARLYVYSYRLLDKAVEELDKAEQRQYKLGPREFEQEADGYRLRAEKEWTELHNRDAAKEDLAHAKDLYRSARDYNDVPGRLRIVARLVAKATKPARQTRRTTWQSPKAGKKRKS